MKTLIVPVDFSAASVDAANYAADFAEVINASIALLYVYQFPIAYTETPVASQTITQLMEDAGKQLQELKYALLRKSGGKLKIYTDIKEGFVSTQLQNYCNDLHPYAVIMGSTGSTAAERVLFGSNTLSAMKHLTAPLIIVPKGARFRKIEKVGLACDLLNIPETVHAGEIKKLVNDFHAELHVLHINPNKNRMIGDEEIEGSEWLRDMLIDAKPNFHFLNNQNVEDAITGFAEKNNLDILIVIPKKHGLLENLFHKSQSKQIALHTHMPLLSIHE